MRARLACIRQAAGYRSVSFLRHTGIECVIATLVRNDNFYFGAMLRRICMHKTGRKSEFSISFSKKL